MGEKKARSSKTRAKKSTSEKLSNFPWWVRGTAETCEFFGISDETLRQWAAKGAPKVARGKWDVKALIAWKYQDQNSAEKRKLIAEAELKETKVIQERLRLQIQEGRYVETAKVTADLRRFFGGLKKSFQALAHNVTTELNSLDPDAALQAKKIVEETVSDALRQISEGKNYGRR